MERMIFHEVGPRDGLQNEAVTVPLEEKIAFIQNLLAAGLKEIEVTSFVSPKHVPQLADSDALWPLLPEGGIYSALVPNQRGLARAMEAGVKRIALFTGATDGFVMRNIGKTVEQSLAEFRELVSTFRADGPGWVRGYVSVAFECPYEGRVKPEAVLKVATELGEMGVDEISIGDTIGVAAPKEVERLGQLLLKHFRPTMIAWHFHDTRGTAIANVQQCLDMGFRKFDSSAAGLGGCPYAPGAGGNLATDDLAYLAEREGYATGVDRVELAKASLPVLARLGKAPFGKAQVAELAKAAAAVCE